MTNDRKQIREFSTIFNTYLQRWPITIWLNDSFGCKGPASQAITVRNRIDEMIFEPTTQKSASAFEHHQIIIDLVQRYESIRVSDLAEQPRIPSTTAPTAIARPQIDKLHCSS